MGSVTTMVSKFVSAPLKFSAWMLTLFVPDEDESRVTELIAETNRTGEIGDGKIFVSALDGAERIRTGEKGEEILS